MTLTLPTFVICTNTAMGLSKLLAGKALSERALGLMMTTSGVYIQCITARERYGYSKDPEPYGFDVLQTLSATFFSSGFRWLINGNIEWALGAGFAGAFVQILGAPSRAFLWPIGMGGTAAAADFVARKIIRWMFT